MKKEFLNIFLLLFFLTNHIYGNNYDFANSLQTDWRFALDGRVIYKPAVDYDGTVYAVTDSRKLYSIGRGGVLHWEKKLTGKASAPPLITYDGSVVVSVSSLAGGSVCCLKPNSTVRWVFNLNDRVTGHLALGSNGNIYIPSGSFLYAIDYRGKLIFRHAFAAAVSAGPSAGKNNTVYAGTNDGRLYAVKNTGETVWVVRLKGAPGDIIIGGNGNIYAGYSGILCIDPNGKLLWNYRFPDDIRGMSENPDGSITAVSLTGKLYRVSSKGEKIAEMNLGIPNIAGVPGSVSLSNLEFSIKRRENKLLFVTSAGGILYLISAQNAEKEEVYPLFGSKSSITGITVVPSGRGILMYTGTEDWILTGMSININNETVEKDCNIWSLRLHDSCNTARQNGLCDSNNGAYLSIREKAFSGYSEFKATALDLMENYLTNKIFIPLYADKAEQILSFLSSESIYNKQYFLGKVINDFPEIRERSNILLGQLGTEAARKALAGLLPLEHSEPAEEACITSLGEIGMDPDGTSEKTLIEAFIKNKKNERIAVSVIKSLERIGIMNRGFKFISTYSKLIEASASVKSRMVQNALERAFRNMGKHIKKGRNK